MCVLLAWAVAARAAMLTGVVVENGSSKPLSGAQVVVSQIGTTAGIHATRTGRNGGFEFSSLAPGFYVIKASRPGFMPMEYGQKRWNSAGTPVTLGENGLSVTLRLPRYGGITGTIVDENDVGWLEGDVAAYRYAEGKPPELTAFGRSDERGVFRISGLEPGMYLVRSAAMDTDLGSFLPTFSKQTMDPAQSRPFEVYLEQDTRGVEVQPVEGKLFTLSGAVLGSSPATPATVTLSSDMGRQTVQGSSFRFTGLAPGNYEIYGESIGVVPILAGYQALPLDHDTDIRLQLMQLPQRRVEVSPSPPGGTAAIQILRRQRDLAGAGEPEPLPVGANGLALFRPGRWEFRLNPPDGYYVASFGVRPLNQRDVTRAEGWNEAAPNNSIWFALSPGPATVQGSVKVAGDPAIGAPVYLEAYEPASQRRTLDLHATRTDLRGAYRFDGLAPGTYRVLSTFEYNSPTVAQMDLAGARTVDVPHGGNPTVDLELYEIR
jgi:hypothetical protein